MSAGIIATIEGKYRLFDRISEGGQGEVWAALDENGAKVAVKIFPRPSRSADQEKVRARFLDEVEAGQALRAPGICQLLDHGELPECPELHRRYGVFYLVMEFIEGGSLEDFIVADEEFELDHLRGFISTICGALHAAHSSEPSIVHRDVKPANILLPDEDLRNPKLADFGLARASDGTRLTSTGVSVGTSLFMAPEQMISSSDVTPAADQYSLALVLCELLTKEIPGSAGEYYAVYIKRAKGVEAPVIEVEGEEAPAVRAVLQKALSVNPADRYPSILDFSSAFDLAGVDDGWWEEEVEEEGIYLDDLSLFILDRRSEGGAMWVGGRQANTSLLRSLYAIATWSYEPSVPELGGASAYRLTGLTRSPGDGIANVGRFLNETHSAASPKTAAPKKQARRSMSNRSPNPAFMINLVPSPALAAVIGDDPLPRTEVVKKLWAYIKKHGLQDQRNKRMINADARLRLVFGGKEKVSMFDMTRIVSRHLS